MTSLPKYYPDLSDVEVEFNDGEVRTYRITASPKIAQYLAREAGENGTLTLFNDISSVGLPMVNIRQYTINPVPFVKPDAEAKAEGAAE